MKTAIVEIDPNDVHMYRLLKAEDEVHDRNPYRMSNEDAVELQMEIMEFEQYLLKKYGDEDHYRSNWQLDAVTGILYIED